MVIRWYREGHVNDIETIVAAFSEEQVERLTGLSKWQLRYWDRTGFFVPTLAAENRRAAFSRIYTFKDVVALRTLSLLRRQYGVPLQHLRKVALRLSELADDLWLGTTLYVLNKRVVFQEPGTGKPVEVVSGQYVLGIPLRVIVGDTKKDVAALRRRPPASVGRFDQDRNVVGNLEVIAGTRVPVATVVRFLADGFSPAEIVREFPTLGVADIQAVMRRGGERTAA